MRSEMQAVLWTPGKNDGNAPLAPILATGGDMFALGSARLGGKFQLGVYATVFMPAGTRICSFGGTPCSAAEIEAMLADGRERHWDDVLMVDSERFVSLRAPYRHFNHSCRPNALLRGIADLYAMRDIAVGDEITYDYAFNTPVDRPWTFSWACECGAESCRRTIADLHGTPVEALTAHLDAGGPQDYIRTLAQNLEMLNRR